MCRLFNGEADALIHRKMKSFIMKALAQGTSTLPARGLAKERENTEINPSYEAHVPYVMQQLTAENLLLATSPSLRSPQTPPRQMSPLAEGMDFAFEQFHISDITLEYFCHLIFHLKFCLITARSSTPLSTFQSSISLRTIIHTANRKGWSCGHARDQTTQPRTAPALHA